MKLTIRQITADQTIDLRHRVLWPMRPRSSCILPDDAAGLHFGGRISGALVSVASVFETPSGARLRKFATAPERQRQGIGWAMLLHLTATLRDAGSTRLWCDARLDAAEFYARLGMTLNEAPFERDGIAFVTMSMPLSGETAILPTSQMPSPLIGRSSSSYQPAGCPEVPII